MLSRMKPQTPPGGGDEKGLFHLIDTGERVGSWFQCHCMHSTGFDARAAPASGKRQFARLVPFLLLRLVFPLTSF